MGRTVLRLFGLWLDQIRRNEIDLDRPGSVLRTEMVETQHVSNAAGRSRILHQNKPRRGVVLARVLRTNEALLARRDGTIILKGVDGKLHMEEFQGDLHT